VRLEEQLIKVWHLIWCMAHSIRYLF